MDSSAEDVAKWLGRETGHVPESEVGYEDEQGPDQEEGEVIEPLGLPNPHHNNMRKFFDGLHLERAMTEKRRMKSTEMLDEAEQMDEALKQAITSQNAPQGGGY